MEITAKKSEEEWEGNHITKTCEKYYGFRVGWFPFFSLTLVKCAFFSLWSQATMKELQKIFKYGDVYLEKKAKIIHIIVFLITWYGCESWAVRKTNPHSLPKTYLFEK